MPQIKSKCLPFVLLTCLSLLINHFAYSLINVVLLLILQFQVTFGLIQKLIALIVGEEGGKFSLVFIEENGNGFYDTMKLLKEIVFIFKRFTKPFPLTPYFHTR